MAEDKNKRVSSLLTEEAHKALSIAKAVGGFRTLSDTILHLLKNQKVKGDK